MTDERNTPRPDEEARPHPIYTQSLGRRRAKSAHQRYGYTRLYLNASDSRWLG